jgi:diguanylate cyclase (GGDEF)-like protein
MGFLAALAVLIANTLHFSYIINSGRLAEKSDTLLLFFFTGFLVTVIFLGLSIPVILAVAKGVSAPIEKILDKTHYDTLTGIYNRRYVDENLQNLIDFIARSGGKLTLLMIEIDFFRLFNDTYGYNKGDNCLKIVANALAKGVSRAEDFVARYGGKEFIVVLPNADENGAHVVAQKLLSKIRECKIPHEKNEAADCVTISIGAVTGKADHSQSIDGYISLANEMLNKSIQNGRNRCSFETL